MEEMEVFRIIARQKALCEELKKMQTNIGKDGPSRKTGEYRSKKMNALETLWGEFIKNHNDVKDVIKQDTPYIQSKTFERMEELYHGIKGQLLAIPEDEDTELGACSISTKPQGNNASTKSTPDLLKIVRRQKASIDALERLLSKIRETSAQSWNTTFCQVQINAINNYWRQIEELHQLAAELMEDSTAEGYDMEKYIRLEEEVNSKIIALTTQLATLRVEATDASKVATSNTSNTSIQLPKITLPKFDGDYLKWRQYCDLFTELVHNQNLANCQKMYYLKTTLTGEAEKLIRHFTTSDANYMTAWKVITERYENARLLVTALINKLLTQPTIQNEGANQIKALHDTTQECILGLNNLGIETSNWGPLILTILLKKLDKTTLTLWEQSLRHPKLLPDFSDFLSFLETRFQSLEALGNKTHKGNQDHVRQAPRVILAARNDPGNNCKICDHSGHPIYKCTKFLQLSPIERYKQVKAASRCINCLRVGHQSTNCSAGHCTKCRKFHHSLLHIPTSEVQKPVIQTPMIDNRTSLSMIKSEERDARYVFLGTAVVNVLARNNSPSSARALLDSGSQMSFITEKLANQLRLISKVDSLQVSGVGEYPIQINRRINLSLQSRITGYNTNLQVYVLKTITSKQPSQYIDYSQWKLPGNIRLADPSFNQPQEVDILIGADLYPELLSVGQIKLPNGPTLQNTVLGWVVIGKSTFENPSSLFCGIGVASPTLDDLVQRFWTLEETPATTTKQKQLNKDELQCEELFTSSTTRTDSGRYIVKLPFKLSPNNLGDSREIATRRFMNLEKRLSKQPAIRRQYVDFMQEYIRLGHMKEVDPADIKVPNFFLPHHCVLRPESTSTKLRVVFDGSSKTSTNISLNDILHTGPALQNDLLAILLRFRTHTYVFTADISKMYRQILVDDSSKQFQNIVWREATNQQLKVYQLTTVTYGTKSAPYLAIRCLQDLAHQADHQHSQAAVILKEDIYMDDILTGSNDLRKAIQMQKEIQSLLNKGQFHLRKWCANTPHLLTGIPKEDCETENILPDQKEGSIKTLGLTWLPSSDQFLIKTEWNEVTRVTKRSILSDISHIFDPMGVMGPVVILAKIFIQELWALKLDWDAALPMEMHTRWMTFRKSLLLLNNLMIPRHIMLPDATYAELHAFSDASQRAYGAVIYLKTTNPRGEVKVKLVCSKSRVAPIKQQTIPRLELCAAKLMTKLTKFVVMSLSTEIKKTTFWTDSQIVLAWIHTQSPLQTFVANRISYIHEETRKGQWKFVNTDQNPADLLSRGMVPEQLIKSSTWFEGPQFLRKAKAEWPTQPDLTTEKLPESKFIKSVLTVNNISHHFLERINHRNSFRTLQRVTAYIIRFISNLKRAKNYRLLNDVLSVQELQSSKTVIIKYLQHFAFSEEINCLKKSNQVTDKSRLSSLSPFLDEKGIIRVGGRLEASNLPYEARHQILLPKSHVFVKLLMMHYHNENLHAGPQALLAALRQQYWILRGKQLAQTIVHSCIRCFHTKPKSIEQLMGNLPTERVQPSRPFSIIGIDFLGPVYIHYRIRGKQATKAYIALFICFAIKAVHLELVTDLTTQAFLGALKRFIARRGSPTKIFSDNATNFMGARNELHEVYSKIFSGEGITHIENHCADKGIQWQPIPPRSPHFGGLWEAAVKSAKYHLKRIFTGASLTQEELTTALAQIEAILNSRPITPLSNNPEDLEALTPGHFLVGAPLTAIPDPDWKTSNLSSAARWNLVTSIHREFWRRWTQEYLQELQTRYKWKHPQQEVPIGTLVLIKDDNLPPLQWRLGRIVRVIQGNDKLSRVVDIKTSTGEIRRSIYKICPLPEEVQPSARPTGDIKVNIPKKVTMHHPLKGRFLPITSLAAGTVPVNIAKKRKTIDDSPSHRQRIRINPVSTLLVSMLAICSTFGLTKGHSPVEVRKFSNNPGIYFEDLGKVSLNSDEWNLYIYFNMTSYWEEYGGLKDGVQLLRTKCEALKHGQSNFCDAVSKHLERRLIHSTNLNEILQHKNGIRKRRSPFDFIGTVANKLFGILDQEYAKNIENNINEATQNQDHLLQLNKNQTSIIESTVNVLNKSLTSIREQFQIINHQLNQINHKVMNTTQIISNGETFNYIAIYVSQLMDSFQQTQSAILDAITDTHQGKISAWLLSPKQLMKELATVHKYLPASLTIPDYDEYNLPKLYQLLTAKARVTSSNIIFLVKLPLLKRQNFHIYKIVPLPVDHDNHFVFIQPSTAFIAITPYRDQYFAISLDEFRRCTEHNNREFLCKQRHPIFNTHSTEHQCELHILNHQKTLSKYCELRESQADKIWIQLHNPNHWIYGFKNEEIFSIVCGSDTIDTKIKGTGLLSLASNCVIRESTMTISAHNFYLTESKMSLIPALNLSALMVTKPRYENPQSFPNNLIIRGEEDLTAIRRGISDLKTNQILEPLTHHDIHQYSIGYLSLLGLLILLLMVIIRRCKKKQPQPLTEQVFELRDLKVGEDV